MTKPIVSIAFVAALVAAGCSSSSGGSGGADSPAGVVIGPPDDHCKASDGGLTVQAIGACDLPSASLIPANAASCSVTFTSGASASGGTDAGVPDGGVTGSDLGLPMYGAAGNDDDCKYYLSWTATPIKENADTFFTVTAIRLADMLPATCAGIRPEVFLNPFVGAIPPPNPSPEIAPGVYQVGPIKFTQPGIWTVRFHLYENCGDSQADSPHGHAAFFVQVP
jgi:hypothetical protein